MAEENIFDHAGVMMRLDNDEELFKELLTIFKEEWPNLRAQLEKAVQANDASLITLHAHSIKGALGNVGASMASLAARELEMIGRSGVLTEAAVAAQKLVAEVNRYVEALQASGYLREAD